MRKCKTAWVLFLIPLGGSTAASAQAASQQYRGGTMASMIHSICMSITTEHRIDEMKQAYENGDRKLE